MSENNDQWRVVTNEPCIGIWEGDYCIADLTDMNIPWEDKVATAHRIVLEHGACAGMSDEEVGSLQGFISQARVAHQTNKKLKADCIFLSANNKALKRDLADALSLLDMSHIILYDAGRYNMAHQVKAFLAKHKKGV